MLLAGSSYARPQAALDTYAILIQGSNDHDYFRNNITFVYKYLKGAGVSTSHMWVLGPKSGETQPSAQSIVQTLFKVKQKAGRNRSTLIFYVTAHGDKAYKNKKDSSFVLKFNTAIELAYAIEGVADTFGFMKIGGNIADQNELTGTKLHSYINKILPTSIRKVVLIDSCYSGGFAKHVKPSFGSVITSAGINNVALQNPIKKLSNFTFHFFSYLKKHKTATLQQAFINANNRKPDLGKFNFLNIFVPDSNPQIEFYPSTKKKTMRLVQ